MSRNKKDIQEQLLDAINREDLPNREAARLLNIHPCYISMLKNEKSWDGISEKAWVRFEEWAETREKLREFKIPDGEEICVPKEAEKKTKQEKSTTLGPRKKREPKGLLDSSPERPIPAFNNEEIDALNRKYEELYKLITQAQQEIDSLGGKFVRMEQVVAKDLQENVNTLLLMGNQIAANNEAILRIAVENRPQTIVFQRNVYRREK